jgi:hypothetical protein
MDKAFDNPCTIYWSSTRHPWSSSSAFAVRFDDGRVGDGYLDLSYYGSGFGYISEGNLFGVRCVRAGQH